MTVGPVSPLSFAGTPLFFTYYNVVNSFFEANNRDLTLKPDIVNTTAKVFITRITLRVISGYVTPHKILLFNSLSTL